MERSPPGHKSVWSGDRLPPLAATCRPPATATRPDRDHAQSLGDRFRGERRQTDRVGRIAEEALDRVAKDPDRSWIVASLVPNGSGTLPISFAGRTEIEEWARTAHLTQDRVDGFFPATPTAGVGVERYALQTVYDATTRPKFAYA
jgi:hypothetical protein